MTVKKTFWQEKKKDFIYWALIALLQFGVGTWFYNKYKELNTVIETVKSLDKVYVKSITMRKIVGKITEEKKTFLRLMRKYPNAIPEIEFWNNLLNLDKNKEKFHLWLTFQNEILNIKKNRENKVKK